MSDNLTTELLDLASNAWSIAVCAMQGMPIPACWGNAVERGLREHGIHIDELPYVVPDAPMGSRKLTAEQVRECVQRVYYEGYNDGSVHRAHGIEETDWQAIADKLNALIGGEVEVRL